MRGLIAFGFHLIGETVFWLKSLYQLGFVRFFDFYFWIWGKTHLYNRILNGTMHVESFNLNQDKCNNENAINPLL